MEDPYSLLADEIQHQYSKISNSFNFDRRLAITEIVRCIDHSFVFISYILPVTHSTYQNAAEIHRFMATGYNQALRIFFDDSTCLSGAPLYPTNSELIDWTNSVLINLGHIGYTLRFIELSKQGLFKLEKKDKYFRFIGLSNTPGKEKQGANDFYWWQNQNEINGDDLSRIQNLAPKIKELLHSESKVWNNHFIQYGRTPELDTYYETLARHYSSNYLGASAGEVDHPAPV